MGRKGRRKEERGEKKGEGAEGRERTGKRVQGRREETVHFAGRKTAGKREFDHHFLSVEASIRAKFG